MNEQEKSELQQAAFRAYRATELRAEFDALIRKINAEFPASTFGLTKAQIAKAQGPEKTLERLKKIMDYPNNIRARIAHRETLERLKQEEDERNQRKIEKENEFHRLRDKAIEFLINRGFRFGQDFTVETAIEAADNAVFQELVEAEISRIERDGNVSFDGDDNCEDCSGWDGVSRRCDCGNRRVAWESDGNFEEMYIRAVAY